VNLALVTISLRFYLTCFARVCEIFTAVLRELQRDLRVVLQRLYVATHMCSVFVFSFEQI